MLYGQNLQQYQSGLLSVVNNKNYQIPNYLSCVMNLEYGLLMGVLGILITIVGFMIAYIVANNVIEKEKKKKEEDLKPNVHNYKV